MKIAKKYDLVIINKEKNVCKGLWPRVQGQERSILDYDLTNSKLLSTITEMIVDDNKQFSAFELEKSRKTYSDHNAILLKLNLVTAIEKQKKNRIITKCGYRKYRNKLTQTQISRVLKKDTIQESYDKWSEEVHNNIKEVEKICRQNPRKDIMQLKRQRKKLRAQYQNTENIYEKTVIIERIKLIKEHITDKMKENRSRRIIKVAQQIKSNVDNGGKIWEVKRKVQRKNQTPHTFKDEKSNRMESSSQISGECKKYYENLLKTRQSETAEETQIQFKVEKEFQQITNRQGDKKERITETIIRKAIRKMKNKKAADRLGWKAEWIKEGGEEMVKSLYILFNRIKTENQIPKQWQLTTVKSIHKGGVKENIQENQRGIFLVNTVSKIYESALKIQNENKNENMSQM